MKATQHYYTTYHQVTAAVDAAAWRCATGNIGVTVCYDLRFPELFTALRRAGAHVILIPSAFMPTTGEAHWEALLRARAIETQVSSHD